MALTPSNMLELGSSFPHFKLINTVNGKIFDSTVEIKNSPTTVVMFICNHCPYVVHIKEELSQFGTQCDKANVQVIAINSNDATKYPDDSPEKMKEDAKSYNYSFPYLYDESQEVAKNFKAACTPDFYVFGAEQKLNYRGQFDDSRPGRELPVSGKDLWSAVEASIRGESIPDAEQKPSMGCNIKWK